MPSGTPTRARSATGLGEAGAFRIASGSYRAGLARHLAGPWTHPYRGQPTRQVHAPKEERGRATRSMPKMVARAVLARVSKDYPKSGLVEVEISRMLKIVEARISGHDRTDAAP